MMCFALLNCAGSEREKAIGLYNLFQDFTWGQDDHTHVSCNDKDVKNFLPAICAAATLTLIGLGKNESVFEEFDEDALEKACKAVGESWLDDVYDRESKLDNERFISEVQSKKGNWIFDSEQIRQKVFEEAGIDYKP